MRNSRTSVFASLRARARKLKSEILALYLALRDPRTPWYAKAFGALVVAYAFSPLDLVPDFVPVLGYLDDVLLLPLGIWLTIRMIPPVVLDESRARAQTELGGRRPTNWVAAGVIVLVWVGSIAAVYLAVLRLIRRG
jgi:uncharacterized membrane protein YkvA (DUF1232 family)